MKTLEDYLQHIYNKISTDRSKESYIEGYEAWIENLDADEVMEYAEDFIAIIREEHKQKEDLPYSVEIENRKIEEETQGMSIKSRHLLDDSIGNPLEQVDSLIEKTKPFLDGITPSYWIYTKFFKSMETERDDLNRDQIRMDIIERCLDLLVEELKKNNVIK